MNEIPTIANLRSLAELNFGPECYKKYLALIEPGIKSIIENYFSGLKSFESNITRTVMRHKGVFKTSTSFISYDSDEIEKYSDLLDVKAFKEINKWRLKQKIDYLHKNGLIGKSTYKLFDLLREKRNTIHDLEVKFSEEDLQVFAYASSISFFLHVGLLGSKDLDKTKLMRDTEYSAERILSMIKK